MLLDDDAVARRNDTIDRLGVLERAGDPGLTALTRLASYISGAMAAAVHILDDVTQHRVAGVGAKIGPHPREDSMCRLVIDDGGRIVCADATRDPRFGYSSFVSGDEPVRFYASVPLATSDGVVIGTLCTFDTREIEISEEQIARLQDLADQVTSQIELTQVAVDLGHMASHDVLTGAVNRLVLGDRLAQAFARRERHGGDTVLALLDVDDFKSINDVHGHNAGDLVLVTIADRLRAVVRGEDTIARIGGDEFVVLTELVPRSGGVEALTDRLCEAMSEPVELEGGPHRVVVSAGCVLAEPGESLRSLLKRADASMYANKSTHKAAGTR